MKLIKYILPSVFAVASLGLSSCSDDKMGDTIFPDVPVNADPSSYTYKFDTWLNRNFRDVYNLNIFYKMKDVETDMNYNLVPATLDRARDLSLLTKYLWFDAYGELVGEDFLKTYGPRIIHLIGSPAYNPTAGTEILGLAEGGLKVSLFKVNEMQLDDINMLNEYYFRTMHHEFGHILHQTKSYPTEFNTLSTGLYDTSNWQNKNGGMMASLGFITPYSSSETREDFAETIANYLTRTDDQLAMLMWCAGQGWSNGKDSTDDSDDDESDDYYSYYYFENDDARNKQEKTYILKFADRPVLNNKTDFRIGVVEGDNISRRLRKDVFLTNPEDTEAYVAALTETLMNEKRNQEAKATYNGLTYAQLNAAQKAQIDKMLVGLQFVVPCEDKDGTDGAAKILQKQNIVRNWFKDVWGLDFDKLREIVQERQRNKDKGLEVLRAEVESIQ